MSRTRYISNMRAGSAGSHIRGDVLYTDVHLMGSGTGQTILEESATQKYDIGARLVEPDGRVFRYCKAGGAIGNSVKACYNDNKPYEGDRAGTAVAIGETEITIPATSTGNAQAYTAKDSYAGGWIWFQQDPHIFHAIKSNTATDGTNQVLTLARPLWSALVASASGADTLWVTIWTSPYANVIVGAPGVGSFRTVVCKPVINVTSGYYFWGQTWGPAFFQAGAGGDGQTTPGKTSEYRNVVFNADGSVIDAYLAAGTANNKQHAGYIISETTTSDGDQLVMLRLSP